MKKIIVDYKNVSRDILEVLVEKYPFGFDDSDIISYKNSQGQTVECVEIVIDDTDYLIKMSKHLNLAMEEFDEDDERELEDYEESGSME